MRLGGQIRTAADGTVIGYDFNAAFALTEALGFNRMAVAELLPDIEEIAMRLTNKLNSDGFHGDG